jgi:hypothetical protein
MSQSHRLSMHTKTQTAEIPPEISDLHCMYMLHTSQPEPIKIPPQFY